MDKRYLKQVKLPEVGKAGQEKLRNSSVLVIGAGGLGCHALMALALAGAGNITIIDGDKVEESNLHRQPLYTLADVGAYKAHAAQRKLGELNPLIHIFAIAERLNESNGEELLGRYELVLDCSDNYPTRYLINDLCVALDKTWVYAAAEQWEGQVSIFNLATEAGRGPTYRCLYPDHPLNAADCNDAGVIGAAPAIAGFMQANEAIKCICGIAGTLSGRLWVMDLLHSSFQTFAIQRDEQAIEKRKKEGLNFNNSAKIELSLSEFISQENKYQLIDIRDEYEAGTLPYPGINIPYHQLLTDLNMLQEGKLYLLACESGKRSLILAKHLREKAKRNNIYSLIGGLNGLSGE